jgi:hypothetical protein
VSLQRALAARPVPASVLSSQRRQALRPKLAGKRLGSLVVRAVRPVKRLRLRVVVRVPAVRKPRHLRRHQLQALAPRRLRHVPAVRATMPARLENDHVF